MGLLDRLRGRPGTDLTPLAEASAGGLEGGALEGTVLPSAAVAAEQHLVTFLAEALADNELAMEDAGWRRLTAETTQSLTRDGLRTAAEVSQALLVSNALLRRGVALRIGYVWGSGVQVAAIATGADNSGTAGQQDVNAVLQEFLDDPGNKRSVTGEQAHEEIERSLATDGNVIIAAFTAPRTGRVRARTLPWSEFVDVVTNPDDRSEVWFYVRSWTQTVIVDATGRLGQETRRELYPAIGHRPATRLAYVGGMPVHWDSPVLHVSVNRLSSWHWGIGDVYPAIVWARGYSEFLGDWKQLVKALSRYAFKLSGSKQSKAQQAAAAVREQAQAALNGAGQGAPARRATLDGEDSRAGAMARLGQGMTLEAIPKSGATIDAESGRPLAAMVAAALDVPVTMILGDPGTTGNRATAETLDEPTKLAMQMRRTRHTEWILTLAGYVITESVRAPGGALRGVIVRDEFGAEHVTLAGDTDPTVECTWPPLDKTDPKARIESVEIAAGLAVLPPLQIARLALQALEVPNVDEVMEELTDDAGNFIDPAVSAGVDAVRRFRQGDPPLTVDPAAGGAGVPAQRTATSSASASTPAAG